MPNKKQVRIYSCGAGGTSIGSRAIAELRAVGEVPYYGDFHPVFLDTSMSNADKVATGDEIHIFEVKGDGSGKHRSEHAKRISSSIDNIVSKYPPLDYNIVIHTGGGGSGSVIGPYLMEHLVKNEKTAVAIMVGGTESLTAARNTRNTLKSYQNMGEQLKKIMPVFYIQNSNITDQALRQARPSEVDTICSDVITTLMTLFSGHPAKLDHSDVHNFFQYWKVTNKGENGLAFLRVFKKESDDDLWDNVISVATIGTSHDDSMLPRPVAYETLGIMEDLSGNDRLERYFPLHFTLYQQGVGSTVARLNKVIADAEAREAATLREDPIITESDAGDDKGMIL